MNRPELIKHLSNAQTATDHLIKLALALNKLSTDHEQLLRQLQTERTERAAERAELQSEVSELSKELTSLRERFETGGGAGGPRKVHSRFGLCCVVCEFEWTDRSVLLMMIV